LNNPSASRVTQLPHRAPKLPRANRNDRLYSALNGSVSSPALHDQFNIVSTPKSTTGISIRGIAGPYIVMAKNFAFGTTAADIESAMTPVGGVALSCRLIAERPNVIAEIIFESKEGADNVVDTFNNQNVSLLNLLWISHIYLPCPGRRQSSACLPQNWRSGAKVACTSIRTCYFHGTRCPSARPESRLYHRTIRYSIRIRCQFRQISRTSTRIRLKRRSNGWLVRLCRSNGHRRSRWQFLRQGSRARFI